LTALQFTTLSVLNRHGTPLSSSQLARRSFMTAQSMHEVTHRLEETGLIKRNPHPNHRRKLPASLTAKGRRVVVACEAAVAEFETKMLRGFSRAERTSFLAMIKAAVRNLGGGFGGSVHPADEHDRAASARSKRTSSKRAA
jgi:DNA-binding MarR family transcriptional regulator